MVFKDVPRYSTGIRWYLTIFKRYSMVSRQSALVFNKIVARQFVMLIPLIDYMYAISPELSGAIDTSRASRRVAFDLPW